MKAFLLIFGVTISSLLGHGGGLDKNGEHNDRKNGGYHYHRGSKAGKADLKPKEKANPWFERINLVAVLLPSENLDAQGKRGANDDLKMLMYLCHEFISRGGSIEGMMELTSLPKTSRLEMARKSLEKRNYDALKKFDCDDIASITFLRTGRAPLVRLGPYKGEPLEIGHIVPVSIHPEFSNWIGNLELMPKALNRKKSNKMGQRQYSYLKLLREASH